MSDRALAALARIVDDLAVDAQSGEIRDLGRHPPFLKPAVVVAHRAHADFVSACQDDPELSRLSPSPGVVRTWISGFEPEVLAGRLINGALWVCTFRGTPTGVCVREYLHQALLTVRDLVAKKPIDVPVIVGFGSELPAGARLQTEWGVLRAWRQEDGLVARDVAEFSPDRGTILESSQTVRLNVIADEEPGSIEVASLEDERWRRVALAFLLVQRGDEAARPTNAWFIGQMQVLSAGLNGGEARQFLKGPVIREDQLGDLRLWLDRVANPRLPEITVYRLTSMVGRLVDHVDAFIDGVIVWENLFGTGDNQELSYRVSMNMACILVDGPAQRLELQKEIKKLYSLRSQVVHGGKHLSPVEAASTRQRVQNLTLEAVRRLLAVHPDLLASSPERFMRLVLGVD